MQAVSIHIVDVANGVVATGMRVDIARQDGAASAPTWTPVVSGQVGRNGVVEGIEGRERLFDIGVYELRLHVGDYYRARGTALPAPAFMDVQVFRFGVADLSQHYHLPVKLTPWGLSCFRGAA
ncbi:hydroxyisourate hydrolase [Variovorax arabinosiphilus]|uniref:hydroxyisourate hydrolase n=1 Tax=Variovorax arabinosiphilus TaxID=3053498 RepID=UPI002575E06E|nr:MULTISPECIES: hydroxyisourate hydrolase [unclassified Variovorax]MDM0122635.1 hydroxyisourate hydrolase [Variovorax sp. J2L1-78]MDM0132369.1 hydroxyisourate hydrolase [Variovorax sp. J2L1-63]MDM0235398.1 hydroxyisourate hydrolase [Variovorax sp. J2R1-6]